MASVSRVHSVGNATAKVSSYRVTASGYINHGVCYYHKSLTQMLIALIKVLLFTNLVINGFDLNMVTYHFSIFIVMFCFFLHQVYP